MSVLVREITYKGLLLLQDFLSDMYIFPGKFHITNSMSLFSIPQKTCIICP